MFRSLVMITAVAGVGMTACGGDDQGDLQAWCEVYNSPFDFEEEDFQTFFEDLQARHQDLAAVAPEEIADANDVLVEAEHTAHEYHESHDWDLSSPRMDARVERDMARSGKELEAFAESNC